MRASSFLLLLVACAAAGGARAAEPPKAEELGRQLYLQYCASCHGVGGKGDGPVTPALKKAPLDLTKIAARRGGDYPVGQISEFIDGRRWVRIHGPREMPVWGDRLGESSPDSAHGDTEALGKVLLIIEYLRTIQDPPVKPAGSKGK